MSPVKNLSKKDSRIEVRVDPDFRREFIQFCDFHKEKSSVIARQALQQYISLGDFKFKLLSYLHDYPESKFRFEQFLKYISPTSEIKAWFDNLLIPEEKKLIENTPRVFLDSLRDVIITGAGREMLKKKIADG